MLATKMAKHLHLISQGLILDGKFRKGVKHHSFCFGTTVGIGEVFIDSFKENSRIFATFDKQIRKF